MKMVFEEVKKKITAHEGLVLKPYKDSVGKLTIGVGRNLDDNGIRPDEADLMLTNDIKSAELDIENNFNFYKDLSHIRQFVLIDMVFNLGISRLLGFKKMISALNLGDYRTAANEMLDSKWATQVGKRATDLAKMMIDG